MIAEPHLFQDGALAITGLPGIIQNPGNHLYTVGDKTYIV